MPVSAWELVQSYVSGLFYQAGAKYNNRIYMSCGLEGVTPLSLVIATPNGREVDIVLQDQASLPTRSLHAMCVFDEKLWITGGLRGVTALTDVLYSADGKTWVKTLDMPIGISGHALVSFGNPRNKMVQMGGVGVGGYNNVISTSSNGVEGTAIIPQTSLWDARSQFGALVYKNKLWVFGGQGLVEGQTTCFNDVWVTDNLTHWTKVLDHAPWSARSAFAFCEWDERMWIIGGRNVDGSRQVTTESDEVWFSRDGLTWQQSFDFPVAMYGGYAAPIDNYIHVFGGVGNDHDVYKMRLG